MRGALFVCGLLAGSLCLARDPFTSLDDTVGYIVIEKKGKVQRYLVIENIIREEGSREEGSREGERKEKVMVIIEPVDTIPEQLKGSKEGFRKGKGGKK